MAWGESQLAEDESKWTDLVAKKIVLRVTYQFTYY